MIADFDAKEMEHYVIDQNAEPMIDPDLEQAPGFQLATGMEPPNGQTNAQARPTTPPHPKSITQPERPITPDSPPPPGNPGTMIPIPVAEVGDRISAAPTIFDSAPGEYSNTHPQRCHGVVQKRVRAVLKVLWDDGGT